MKLGLPIVLAAVSWPFFSHLAEASQNVADLAISVTPPGSQLVNVSNNYSVIVSNNGRNVANNVQLILQFPLTNTSPQRFVLGTLAVAGTLCSVQLGTVTCNLGSVAKGTNKQVNFTYAAPVSSAPIQIQLGVSTSSPENVTANNTLVYTPALQYVSRQISGPVQANNSHCTGTGLTSYFECEKFPSSISQHVADFAGDGTITFPDYPSYYGYWNHPNGDTTKLHFEYWENGSKVAEFEGRGAKANCFDGLTQFYPASTYVSAYRVCL